MALLLADREQISLSDAALDLVRRARIRTPLGAAEMLEMRAHFGGRDGHDERLQLAAKTCHLYQEIFAREYASSQAPHFSIQREHEFYGLVDARLFPLQLQEGVSLKQNIEHDPRFFLPFIPVRPAQQHNWVEGCCGFDGTQLVFQLALVLARHHLSEGWGTFARLRGLEGLPEPAPPVAGLGWIFFLYACGVEQSPLRDLRLPFHMIAYKTGSVWLDLPPIGMIGQEWSPEEVAKLLQHRRRAEEINARVVRLNLWLLEDLRARVGRVIEIWNKAYAVEAESGYGGVAWEDVPETERAGAALAVADALELPPERVSFVENQGVPAILIRGTKGLEGAADVPFGDDEDTDE